MNRSNSFCKYDHDQKKTQKYKYKKKVIRETLMRKNGNA